MQLEELSHPVDTELLTRAAVFVNETLDIDHMQVLRGEETRPEGAVATYIEMHNRFKDQPELNDATFRTIGMSLLKKHCALVYLEQDSGVYANG